MLSEHHFFLTYEIKNTNHHYLTYTKYKKCNTNTVLLITLFSNDIKTKLIEGLLMSLENINT